MKNFWKKIIIVIGILSLLMGSSVCYAKSSSTGINVNYHTQQEIRDYLKKNKVDLSAETTYKTTPSAKAPYKAGAVSSKSLKSALSTMNAVRYIAGIDANVTLDSSYNKQAQAAALVNEINGRLSHYPGKPSGMSTDLYDLGYKGAGSSNIAYTSWKTGFGYSIINLWMNDGDNMNIDCVGHRRWILNPSMQKTGFGMVSGSNGTFSAMYVFDNVSAPTDYYGVAWPAQNMPIEYFGASFPWSISMGTIVDETKIKVTLTRKSDNKKWTFSSKKADGYFGVDNAGYGKSGCIIFRPKNITYSIGDQFQVKITGLSKTVTYDVNFFSVEKDPASCSHSYGKSRVTAKASLTANGKKTSTCSKCGHIKTSTIYKASAFSLAKKSIVYSGKTQTPTVTVKTSKGKKLASSNYTVTCDKTPKNPGIYQVTIKLKGEYTGKKVLSYTIKPKSIEIQTLKPQKKALTLTTKRGTGITGYQIACSTTKNFTDATTQTLTVKGQSEVKNTIKKLKSGKRYYIRVRTYKTTTSSGKKTNIYSAWSKVKDAKAR